MAKKKKINNIETLLEIERKDAQNPNMDEYDFIYRTHHILSPDEQKIKAEELTKITEIKKDNK